MIRCSKQCQNNASEKAKNRDARQKITEQKFCSKLRQKVFSKPYLIEIFNTKSI